MRFVVEIDCDNAAFEDEPASELIRILKNQVLPALRDGEEDRRLRDINGNTVGRFQILED